MNIRLMLMAALMPLLAACGTVTVSLPPYTAVTTDEIDGTIDVRDFSYTPKAGVAQNEIRETAAGRIMITEPIGTYYANALRRELRQATVSLRGGRCVISGEVRDFAIDSLGFSSDYITDVRYVVSDSRGQPAYERDFKVKFNTTKFVAASIVLANINKMVADNLRQFLNDPQFRALMGGTCGVPRNARERRA